VVEMQRLFTVDGEVAAGIEGTAHPDLYKDMISERSDRTVTAIPLPGESQHTGLWFLGWR
jgi:hypothetical protein